MTRYNCCKRGALIIITEKKSFHALQCKKENVTVQFYKFFFTKVIYHLLKIYDTIQ